MKVGSTRETGNALCSQDALRIQNIQSVKNAMDAERLMSAMLRGRELRQQTRCIQRHIDQPVLFLKARKRQTQPLLKLIALNKRSQTFRDSLLPLPQQA